MKFFTLFFLGAVGLAGEPPENSAAFLFWGPNTKTLKASPEAREILQRALPPGQNFDENFKTRQHEFENFFAGKCGGLSKWESEGELTKGPLGTVHEGLPGYLYLVHCAPRLALSRQVYIEQFEKSYLIKQKFYFFLKISASAD